MKNGGKNKSVAFIILFSVDMGFLNGYTKSLFWLYLFLLFLICNVINFVPSCI